MTARDDLLNFIGSVGFDGTALVNAFAHELAGSIREDTDGREVPMGSHEVDEGHHYGMHYAANLIDPGVAL